MRVGSLCTGYGGLDLAVGGEMAYLSEIDRHANVVINARFPGVPNLGDLTELDTLPECDVLTAGFPCQPVSQAGQRKGTDDERWLWDDIERLLGNMERPPGVVFFENVRGLLTANGGDAMARVVQGLAGLGYVGSYRIVAAADVGAPHRRERVFIRATHSESINVRRQGSVTEPFGHNGRGGGGLVADPYGGRLEGCPQPDEREAGRKPASRRNDPDRSGLFGPYWPAVHRWERIIGRPAPAPTDADSGPTGRDTRKVSGEAEGTRRAGDDGAHESGVTAGRARLNPRFVEWMMGLPDGWVCDLDLPRTTQLKILGNGVVPQQARYAWEMMS